MEENEALKSKLKRRSSLKRQSTSDNLSRNENKEVVDVKRRVSFASSNKVKPFAHDPEKLTIWDNSYQEEIEQTDSMGSKVQLSTTSHTEICELPMDPVNDKENVPIINNVRSTLVMDDTFIDDKLLLITDLSTTDMEFTCNWDVEVIEKPKPQYTSENITVCQEFDMSMTQLPNVGESRYFETPVISKKNQETINNDSDMEFTCKFNSAPGVIKNLHSTGKEAGETNDVLDKSTMEFTCKFGVPQSILTLQTQSHQPDEKQLAENVEDLIDRYQSNLTSTAVNPPPNVQDFNNIQQNHLLDESSMEFTCKFPQDILTRQVFHPPQTVDYSVGNVPKNGSMDKSTMEFTCKFEVPSNILSSKADGQNMDKHFKQDEQDSMSNSHGNIAKTEEDGSHIEFPKRFVLEKHNDLELVAKENSNNDLCSPAIFSYSLRSRSSKSILETETKSTLQKNKGVQIHEKFSVYEENLNEKTHSKNDPKAKVGKLEDSNIPLNHTHKHTLRTKMSTNSHTECPENISDISGINVLDNTANPVIESGRAGKQINAYALESFKHSLKKSIKADVKVPDKEVVFEKLGGSKDNKTLIEDEECSLTNIITSMQEIDNTSQLSLQYIGSAQKNKLKELPSFQSQFNFTILKERPRESFLHPPAEVSLFRRDVSKSHIAPELETMQSVELCDLQLTTNNENCIQNETDKTNNKNGLQNDRVISILANIESHLTTFKKFELAKIDFEAIRAQTVRAHAVIEDFSFSNTLDKFDLEKITEAISFSTSTTSIDVSSSSSESSLHVEELPDCLHERIIYLCKKQDRKLKLQGFKDKTLEQTRYVFTAFYERIVIVVDIVPTDGLVIDMRVDAVKLDNPDGVLISFAVTQILYKLEQRNVRSSLGFKYDILSILDYVILSVENVMNLSWELQLLKLKHLTLKIHEDHSISFKILSRRPPIEWKIRLEMPSLDKLQLVELQTKSKQQDAIVEHVKTILRNVEENQYCIGNFIDEMKNYFIRTQLRRSNIS